MTVFVFLSGAGICLLEAQTVTINNSAGTIEINEGGGSTITSVVTGCMSISSYTWQFKPLASPDWQTVTGAPFLTAFSNELVITSITCEYQNFQFRLRLDCGNPDTDVFSNVVTLVIVPIPPPTPTIQPTPPVCPNTDVTLSLTPVQGTTYTWHNNSGVQLGSGNSFVVTPAVTTTYQVRKQNACGTSAFTSFSVTVNATAPTAPTQVTANPTVPCQNNQVTLTASGGSNGTYVWYSSMGTQLGVGSVLVVNQAINNTVYLVRRENNCGMFSADFEFTLTTQPGPAAIISNPPEALCVGDSYSFQAGGGVQQGATYTWSFSGGSPSNATGIGPHNVTYAAAGSRTVTLTVSNAACNSMVATTFDVLSAPTLRVNDILVTGNFEYEVAENTTSDITLSANPANATFNWSFEVEEGDLDGNPGSGTGPSINQKWSLAKDEKEAVLICTVEVVSGTCSKTFTFRVIIKKLLFIPNVITANGDGENDCWNIELLVNSGMEAADLAIELYARNGMCVRGCDEAFTVADAVEWCSEGCPAGVYYYRITGPEGFEERGALTLVK